MVLGSLDPNNKPVGFLSEFDQAVFRVKLECEMKIRAGVSPWASVDCPMTSRGASTEVKLNGNSLLLSLHISSVITRILCS